MLLPAAAWGEKDGTVTNSERRITRQRAFMPAPGEARADWWIVSQVARRMGFASAFSYRVAADVFREHAALSAFENGRRRDFDLGGLAGISDPQFEALAPTQWPVRTQEKRRQRRFFADGGFFTAALTTVASISVPRFSKRPLAASWRSTSSNSAPSSPASRSDLRKRLITEWSG